MKLEANAKATSFIVQLDINTLHCFSMLSVVDTEGKNDGAYEKPTDSKKYGKR
jgi:hypothetical protein